MECIYCEKEIKDISKMITSISYIKLGRNSFPIKCFCSIKCLSISIIDSLPVDLIPSISEDLKDTIISDIKKID